MLVSRIMPYSGIASNSKNRTNATSNVAFQARAPRLPEDFVILANKVVAKYKELYKPVSEAHDVLSLTKSTADAVDKAHEIIQKGVTLEAPVVIAGKTQICKAEVGQYFGGKELSLDVFTGKEARRYRITLHSLFDYTATNASKLTVQKIGQDGHFADFVQVPHDEKLAMMRTLLEALAK